MTWESLATMFFGGFGLILFAFGLAEREESKRLTGTQNEKLTAMNAGSMIFTSVTILVLVVAAPYY